MKTPLIGCLLLAFLTGCTTAAPTAPAPGPQSCEEAEGVCLVVSFDGQNCSYDGPAELQPGPVTLIFRNNAELNTAVNLVKHTGDQTIQDMIDYLGLEPSKKHHPEWSRELGTASYALSGGSHTWVGVVEPGIHTMACWAATKGAWFGGGIAVGE